MNKILIGSDEGAYTPTAGARTIVLSELSFTPSTEQLAYLYNKTQDQLYYAPAEGLALASISGSTITIDNSFAVLGGSDVLHIQMWRDPDSASEGSGGNISNAAGDFVATVTASTTNITITGLSFTLEDIHVLGGYIKKVDSSGNVTNLPLTDVTVSGGVITLADAANFASGDTVLVSLLGPDKAYDSDLDANLSYVLNPEYAAYTSVEHLINESNLGIDGTHDGTAGQDTVFTDTGETFTAETVAEGYRIFNVTDGTSAIIDVDSLEGLAGDGGAGNPTADDITHAALGANWDTDTASIPECKRFVIPFEGYRFMTIDVLLDSQDGNNSCYCKIYATNDDTADDTDDVYWTDMSTAIFGAAQLSADGIGAGTRTVHKGVYIIDTPTQFLKYMIKIVAENDDGTQDNEFDIRIKKYN